MTELRSKTKDTLFQAILNLKTIDECYAFFDDLCTIKELTDMVSRLETAKMLNNGENYQSITKKVGASTATISRVNRCLRYGSGGYQTALARLENMEKGGGENDH